MTMRLITSTIFVALALSACVPGASIDTQDDVIAAAAFVEADLRMALADAQAHDDRSAVQCYSVLLERVIALPERTATPVVGAISAFQKARNVRRALDEGVPEDVHIACAALVADTRSTALRVLRLIRGAIL